MEYSGPASFADVEADHSLSNNDDDQSMDIRHPPELRSHHDPAADAVGPHPKALAPASSKRLMEHGTDTSSASWSPAAKTPKHNEAPVQHRAPDYSLPRPLLPPSAPAFAPQDKYVKLAFKENPSCDMKHRWLSEVTKAFSLDQKQAEVKMSAHTFPFVYISRRRKDIINRVTSGEFLSLHLDIQDSINRPCKFPAYLITHYPVGVDPSLAKELPGVHTVHRLHQNGTPVNCLMITWSLLEPPPSIVNFSFLPCLPPCELRRMKDKQPSCFNCQGVSHISCNSSASEKRSCCAASHTICSCPYRTPSTPAAVAASTSTSEPSSPPAPNTSQGKCPRRNMPRVNVGHGCAKQPHTSPPHRAVPSPPPPPPPPPPVNARFPHCHDPADVIALCQAIAALEFHCTAFTAHFDTIDAHIDTFIKQQATTSRTLASSSPSYQVVATVAALTEKLDAVVSHLERLGGIAPSKVPCGG